MRLITLCSSLQSSEASTASQSLIPLLPLDPCSGKGREQRPLLGNSHCGLLICPQLEPSLKVTSQHQEVLLLHSEPAGEFIKVVGQALEYQNEVFPALPDYIFFFSANQ